MCLVQLWQGKVVQLDHRELERAVSGLYAGGKGGKTPADALVAEALFERAVGYEWTKEQAIKVKTVHYGDNDNKLRETEEVRMVEVTKSIPPDRGAPIFWLKNRQPETWPDGRKTSVPSRNMVSGCLGWMPKERQPAPRHPSPSPARLIRLQANGRVGDRWCQGIRMRIIGLLTDCL